MIPGRTVFCLAFSQFVAWGITYYLIGVFGERIVADLGWDRGIVYGGLAAGLLVMGLISSPVGRLIDRVGGRWIMITGTVVIAAGCALLASSDTVVSYYAAWVILGFGMRLTLYDAAFATLARIGGLAARKPMSQVTLLGGLASSVFWPIGHLLAEEFGWRGAVYIYALIALALIPVLLSISDRQIEERSRNGENGTGGGTHAATRHLLLAGGLFALIECLAVFLSTGMSAHLIVILTGGGLSGAVAVWVSTLRGVGQVGARLCEVLSGSRLHPLHLNIIWTFSLPIAFGLIWFFSNSPIAAGAFTILFGVGIGLSTITRGSIPLVLFDHRTYGRTAGRLIAPSFAFSASAPIAYAWVIERFGIEGAILMSVGVSVLVFLAGLLLWAVARPRPSTEISPPSSPDGTDTPEGV